MKTMMKTIKSKWLVALSVAICHLSLSTTLTSCVDNDDDVPENYYASTKVTAAGFLEKNPEQFSSFIDILKRTGIYPILATYGDHTVYAPTNEGVQRYLSSNGYGSIDQIPSTKLDTLARTHIILKGAFFTTDVSEGAMPELNMNDAFITLSSDSDVYNHNALVYYVNTSARIIERDDSVTNGVVHVVDNIISASNKMLPDQLQQDSTVSIFSDALMQTKLYLLLQEYIDENYKCSEDSVFEGKMVRCTSGSELYTRSFWVGTRYIKYTAFVEPDSVFHRYGIYNVKDLFAYAKKLYDQTYPADAGLYDDDYSNRKNPLNRFVAYHLIDRIGEYNSWVVSGNLRRDCWMTNVTDPEEFFPTMCPGTIVRFAGPPDGLFINRKGFQKKASVRGVKVLSPSESGSTNRQALNGMYHYIDDILAYTTEVRDVVLNCRIRVDATALSPDFMNCNGRGRYGENILTGFKNDYISGWKLSPETYVGVHSDVDYWNSYQSNAVCVSGIFDVTFNLPPVPGGTYEIRLGYTSGSERGVVQVYLDNEPCGIPVDLRVNGDQDPAIGWVADTSDEEENAANDKAMHNRGYMKGIDSYRSANASTTFRDNQWNLRRILTTQTLKEGQTYQLRFRQVLDDPECYWSFDFIELCPKSVYDNPQGEDTH